MNEKRVKLTHSCRDISLASVVCSSETFENNFKIKCKFTKYLKKSCGKGSDPHFLFKYARMLFAQRYYQNSKSVFACLSNEWGKESEATYRRTH